MSTDDVDQVQHQLQSIVVSVARTHSRRPAEEVGGVLSAAIHGAGIEEQPQKWVQDTAEEIASGRLVVLNARESRDLGVDTPGDPRPSDGEGPDKPDHPDDVRRTEH